MQTLFTDASVKFSVFLRSLTPEVKALLKKNNKHLLNWSLSLDTVVVILYYFSFVSEFTDFTVTKSAVFHSYDDKI